MRSKNSIKTGCLQGLSSKVGSLINESIITLPKMLSLKIRKNERNYTF